MSKAPAACTFSVSHSSVKRYVNEADRGESLAPKKEAQEAWICSETRREGKKATRRCWLGRSSLPPEPPGER